jgi:DNA-binding response OmpR family regulator
MSRILLINDEDDLLYMYRLALEAAGHTVETTTDGNDAIERAKRFRPDVIGLDWVLPGSGGEELLRAFRATPQTRTTPILVISALGGLRERVGPLGADGFLAKPFRPPDLIKAMHALLERQRHAEPAASEVR